MSNFLIFFQFSSSSTPTSMPLFQKNTTDTVINEFFTQMIIHGRNAKRENPLHYVCNLNGYQYIETLLENGCDLCQQDCMGRTPIHVAIDAGHCECIQVLRRLLRNYNSLDVQLQQDLIEVLKCYNNKGYTILHEAVLKDMKELIQDLLTFCQERNINFEDSEVLGCGDSILHLAVRKNLLEVAEIICRHSPILMKCRNYGGSLPGDLNCITDEMRLVLKCRL